MKTTILLTLSLLAAQAAYPASQSYVFLEEGATATGAHFARIGTLTFDGAGGVTGTGVFRAAGLSRTDNLTGSYSTADGTLQLLTPDSDTEGEAISLTSNFSLTQLSATEWAGLRSDSGVNSTLELHAVSASAFQAKYKLVERGSSGSGEPLSAYGLFTFDQTGAVAATLLEKYLNNPQSMAWIGTRFTTPDGIGSISLLTSTSDSEESSDQKTGYYFVAYDGGNSLLAVRSDDRIVSSAHFTAAP